MFERAVNAIVLYLDGQPGLSLTTLTSVIASSTFRRVVAASLERLATHGHRLGPILDRHGAGEADAPPVPTDDEDAPALGDPEDNAVLLSAHLLMIAHDTLVLAELLGVDVGRAQPADLVALQRQVRAAIGLDDLVAEAVARAESRGDGADLPADIQLWTFDGEAERDPEQLDRMAADYEAGTLTFVSPVNEGSFLNEIGLARRRAGRLEEAASWFGLARSVAARCDALTLQATADLNAALCYADTVRGPDPEEELEPRAAWATLCLIGLAYASEGLRLVAETESRLTPEDRFAARETGYQLLFDAALDLVASLGDVALQLEFQLNARGAWFYRDLLAAGAGAPVELARAHLLWRGRSWITEALIRPDATWWGAPDADLADEADERRPPEATEVLARADRGSEAAWLGLDLAADGQVLAWSFALNSEFFSAGSSPIGDSAVPEAGESTIGLAARLGATLPEWLWGLVDDEAGQGGRGLLLVTADDRLPPLHIGLWTDARRGRCLADVFDVVYCPTLAHRSDGGEEQDGHELFVVCDPLGDLVHARLLPPGTTAALGNAQVPLPPANRRLVLDLLRDAARRQGEFIYQGHSIGGSADSPGSAALLLEPEEISNRLAEPWPMLDLLTTYRGEGLRLPARVAFLSCGSGQSETRRDTTALATGALAAGAVHVISSIAPLTDDPSWDRLLREMSVVLQSRDPRRAFGLWQAAASAESLRRGDGLDRSIASIALFGGPLDG